MTAYSPDELLALVKDYAERLKRRDRECLHLHEEVTGLRLTNDELRSGLQRAEERAESAENELSHLQAELDEEAMDWNRKVDAL